MYFGQISAYHLKRKENFEENVKLHGGPKTILFFAITSAIVNQLS